MKINRTALAYVKMLGASINKAYGINGWSVKWLNSNDFKIVVKWHNDSVLITESDADEIHRYKGDLPKNSRLGIKHLFRELSNSATVEIKTVKPKERIVETVNPIGQGAENRKSNKKSEPKITEGTFNPEGAIKAMDLIKRVNPNANLELGDE